MCKRTEDERTEIHLVARDRDRTGAADPPPGSTLRISLGSYYADIIRDRRAQISHWIIQRQGSPEIIQTGQERTFAEASTEAERSLQSLVRRERAQGA